MPDLDKREEAFKASNKKHQKLYDHYVEAFKQEPIFCLCLKKNVLSDEMKPITTLVFEPTEDMPFWKLCTIGASDYLMPERDIGWARKANQRKRKRNGYCSTHCSGQLLNMPLTQKKTLRFPIQLICRSKENIAGLLYCYPKYLNRQA